MMNMQSLLFRAQQFSPTSGFHLHRGSSLLKVFGMLLLLHIALQPQLGLWLLLLVVVCVLFATASNSLVVGLAVAFAYETVADNFFESDPSTFIGPLNVYASDVIWMFYLGITLFRLLRKRSVPHERSREWRWFLAFFALVVCSLLIGLPVYAQSAVGDARRFLSMLSVASYSASFALDERLLMNVFKLFVVFVGIHVLLAFLRWSGIVPMPWYVYEFREEGLWAYRAVDENKTFYMVVLMSAIFVFIRTGILTRRPSLYILMGGLLLMVIVMQHRSVWIVAIVTMAFFFFMLFPLRTKIVSAAAIVLFCVFLFSSNLQVSGGIIGTVYDSAVSSWDDPTSTANWRVLSWISLVETMSLKDYLIGSTFGTYFPGRTGLVGEINVYTSPHNMFVRMLYKLGFLGLLVYSILQVGLMRHLWYMGMKARELVTKSTALILLSTLIGFNAMFFSYEPAFDFGIFLGLSLAFVQKDKGQNSSLLSKGVV